MSKPKRKWKPWQILLLVLAVPLAFVLLRLLAVFPLLGLLLLGSAFSRPELHTDIIDYPLCVAATERSPLPGKYGMDETIFPREVTPQMQVEDFLMVYYDPWDGQWLGYLTVYYPPQAYEQEMERLAAFPEEEYEGIYSVTGFSPDYELAALHVDEYQGYVYALTDGVGTITYVELIFCNYFMDLDPAKYIPADYLPVGFDASNGNPYQLQKRRENFSFFWD